MVILTMILSLAASPALFAKSLGSDHAAALAELVSRKKAEFSYWAFYKLPSTIGNSLAGVLAFRDPAATATTTSSGARAINVPVLVYHGEGDAPTSPPTPAFIRHMYALKKAGWHTITMEQFEGFMKGRIQVPDKSFVLTFDDGRRDAFYATDPVLKDLGYTAVMFVITGFSMPDGGDKPISDFYVSKAELASMVQSGRWELESHGEQDHRLYEIPTATSTAGNLTTVKGEHFLSNFFWLPDTQRLETEEEFTARVTHDLAFSKKILEDTFHIRVNAFAYPLNDFGQDTINNPQSTSILARVVPQVYPFAFYQTWPGNGDSANYPDPNAYFLNRIEPNASWSSDELIAALESARIKPLPYDATTFGRDWNSNWGAVAYGSKLMLDASEDSTGASAFLNGTQSWKNYAVTATAAIQSGTFSLISRYTKNDAPYVVCAFSEDRIYLERHTGTVLTKLASSPYNPPKLPSSRTVSMTIEDGDTTCSGYGVSVHAYVPDIPARGGIGATVWTPGFGNAHAAISRLHVESR